MVDLAFTTQVDTVLGTLEDGTKVVSTLLTNAGAGTDATDFTIKPLTRIIAYVPSVKKSVANVFSNAAHFSAGTNSNQIKIHAPASIATANIEIWSIGI